MHWDMFDRVFTRRTVNCMELSNLFMQSCLLPTYLIQFGPHNSLKQAMLILSLILSITAVCVALCNIQTSQPNRLTHTNQLYVVWLPIVCMVPVLMHWIQNTRHAQHIQQRRVICEIMITWWLVIFVPAAASLRKGKTGWSFQGGVL